VLHAPVLGDVHLVGKMTAEHVFWYSGNGSHQQQCVERAALLWCCMHSGILVPQVRAVGVEEGEERRLRAQLRQMESRRAALERCSLVRLDLDLDLASTHCSIAT
jgi:hypothetical protein